MVSLRIIEFVSPGVEAIAATLGFFASHEVERDVVRTRSSGEQRDRMLSGERDLAITATDNLIAWNAAGADLRIVAQLERTTVLDLFATADIASLADFRGRTLAVDAVDSGFAIVLRKLLADHGLGSDEFELRPEGAIPERLAAMVEGRAVGAILAPPWSAKAEEAGLRHLGTVEEVLPAFPGCVAVVREARLAELDEAISRYLGALNAALRWIDAATREAALSELMSAGFDRSGADALLSVLPQRLDPSRAGLDLLYDMRQELGLLPDGAPGSTELLALAPLSRL